MLEGVHLVDVYLAREGVPETLVVLDDALVRADVAALLRRVPEQHVVVVSRKFFDELATLPADVAVLAVVATPTSAPQRPGDFCLLLDGVQDPGNVGTMIRTAAAAGVDQVLLSTHCAFAWSPKALRAGQGAHFLTTIAEGVDLVAWAKSFREELGRVVATLADAATPLYDADLRGRIALAIGSEGGGLSAPLRDAADVRVAIPMAPGSESLNAAAAAAVVLFEAVRQRAR